MRRRDTRPQTVLWGLDIIISAVLWGQGKASVNNSISFLNYRYLFIHWEREREREHAHGCMCVNRGRGSGIRRENLQQTPDWACPDMGLHLMTLRSWLELKSRVGCLTDWASQVPQNEIINIRQLRTRVRYQTHMLKFQKQNTIKCETHDKTVNIYIAHTEICLQSLLNL